MPFDEFLDRRLAELLRFAIVLCGDPSRADELVISVLVRAYPHWSAVVAADRPFAAVRTAVVREFLDTGHKDVGAGGMPARTSAAGGPAHPADLAIDVAALATGLRALPAHPRAALCLSVFSGQTEPEIAAALRRPLEAVLVDLADAGAALDAATDSGDRARLIDLFDEFGDSFEFDGEAVASAVVDRLERAPHDDADPAEYAAMFTMSLPAPLVVVGTDRDGDSGNEVAAQVERWAWAESVAEESPAGAEDPDAVEAGGGAGSRLTVAAFGRPTGVAIVLVIIAAGVSLLLSAARQQNPSQPSAAHLTRSEASPVTPVLSTSGPSASAAGHLLPGTTVIGQYFGAGSRTVHAKRHTPGDDRVLAIYALCSGPGTASIGPAKLSACENVPTGASVTSAQLRSLKVRADPSTTWQFEVVDEPSHRTTGTLRYPVNPALTSGSPVTRVAQASGTGSARVALESGTTTSRVENLHLVLTCKGSGVGFASKDHRFDGQYTHTCFPGWSYEFDIASAVVPDTLSVRAEQDTSWRLVVIRS